MSRSEANIQNLNNIKGTDERIYQASVLADISISLAQIADALTSKQALKNGTMAQWVHSEPHKVKCSRCGCQVSMVAAYNMKYCFECGAKMQTTENNY